jgi:hypothetical protein
MRSWRPWLAMFVLSGMLAALAAAGCGGNAGDEDDIPSRRKKAGAGPGGAAADPDAGKVKLVMGKGSLKGKVVIAGDFKSKIADAQADLDKAMAAKPTELDHCIKDVPAKAAADKEQQSWRVGPNGEVANVFVWLKPGAGAVFDYDDKHPGVVAVKDQTVEIDQPHCAFNPHAVFLFPGNKKVQTGQKFSVKNTATFQHNTSVPRVGKNELLGSGSRLTLNLSPSADPYPISCTIHPWMNAVAWVSDNPYYALTNEKGEFEIKNVPVGKVKLFVWHEKTEFIKKGEDLELKEDNAPLNLELSAR